MIKNVISFLLAIIICGFIAVGVFMLTHIFPVSRTLMVGVSAFLAGLIAPKLVKWINGLIKK